MSQRGLLVASYKRLEKDSDRAIPPVAEAVRVPAHLAPPESPQAKQLRHLHTQLSPGQSCHRQKMSCVYARWATSVVANSLRPCRLWPARLLCQRGFSRQEYWSILANTGCHTLLELSISCCPSCQLLWVPGAAGTPATQAAAPPPQLYLTGANPSPPGQPQELTPVDKPHAEVEIKPQLKPRDSVAEEDPNLPTSCESCNLDPHNPLSRSTSVSVESIKGRWALPQGKHTGSDSCGRWRQELTGVGLH